LAADRLTRGVGGRFFAAMPNPALRRVIDLPGVRDLEHKALMNSRLADAGSQADYPEIDELCRALFGLTEDEADEVVRPDGWDRIERKPERDQIIALEAEGWDVTDDKGRPPRMFEHLCGPLWLAVRGVAGTLPFLADADGEADMTASLAAEAAKFRRDRR
jgi:hypothetical protein